MGSRVAIVVAAIALTAGGAGAASAETPIEIRDPPSVGFRFGLIPSKLSRTKPTPVRVSFSGRNRTDDGSHVPPVREVKLKLDRRFRLGVEGVPVCKKGFLDVRTATLEGCEDALVGQGNIEVETAFPKQRMISVSGHLNIYNRGRKPGGLDLVGWAYFPAPATGAVSIPIKVRRTDAGRYGWKALVEVPEIAGGYGSIIRYSARFREQIISATCGGDGTLQVRAASTFADGFSGVSTVIRTCSVPEAHSRQ